MKKTLEITSEMVKLIPFINFEETEDKKEIFVPKYHIFKLGDHLLEDMAMILGYQDKMIPGTENDPLGAAYIEEYEEKMLSIHKTFVDNIIDILTIIQQMSIKGGVKPGTYVCNPKDMIWERTNNLSDMFMSRKHGTF